MIARAGPFGAWTYVLINTADSSKACTFNSPCWTSIEVKHIQINVAIALLNHLTGKKKEVGRRSKKRVSQR